MLKKLYENKLFKAGMNTAFLIVGLIAIWASITLISAMVVNNNATFSVTLVSMVLFWCGHNFLTIRISGLSLRGSK